MKPAVESIDEALEILDLPRFITRDEIKKQYRFLARKYHPDRGGDAEMMERINAAYRLLMRYIEDFRYTFDEDEIKKQFPGADYGGRFTP